ncbi:MAG: recombinase family protein [Lachnospiraceae bacterium]|nr:recombinase family protein [Lachnospiraceae bacterium]
MSNKIKKIYHAAIYVRLSKEDGDVSSAAKAESNSISNQKNLIRDFLKDKEDIEVVSERVDDGYSGSNFERPAFKLMLEDIKKGIVDCVIVKDLSRFGREYIDSGRYIERLFPALGVRFIAINDNYDSLNGKDQADEIIIPFKNLINDAYCRDISVKIRSHLEVKRKNGEFIGSFAPYGYQKSENDRNSLVIDPIAAGIVRDIFRMKLHGLSQDAIANRLNDTGVLSPMEYKNAMGSNYQSSFKTSDKAVWSSVAVRRILENELYIGTLVQGRQTTPNHKVKKTVLKPEKDWVRIEKNHEAIISDRDFSIVQRLLGMDTRISPKQSEVYPLAGLIVCADCGAAMVRKNAYAGGKKYQYYVCSRNKETKECSNHRIAVDRLEETVLQFLQVQISNILDLKQVMEKVSTIPFQELDIKELEKRIGQKETEIERCKELRNMLYEDMKDGIVSKEDYMELHEAYTQKRDSAEEAVRKMKQEIKDILASNTDKYKWLDYFAEHQNIDRLTRNVAVELIDRVRVIDKNSIEVVFSFEDCYKEILNNLQHAGCEVVCDEFGRVRFEWKEAV